jgi:cyclophilin family peptidyl-prolyl cis-trans isomerase
VGGDPRFASEPRQPIQYPAEQSTLPLVAGTVVMRPVRPAPPANGSTFVIMLRPQPTWTGQVTVLGQVVEGLDVVQQLSRVPSSMRNSQPNFKPLREVKIKRVTIREKPTNAVEP